MSSLQTLSDILIKNDVPNVFHGNHIEVDRHLSPEQYKKFSTVPEIKQTIKEGKFLFDGKMGDRGPGRPLYRIHFKIWMNNLQTLTPCI